MDSSSIKKLRMDEGRKVSGKGRCACRGTDKEGKSERERKKEREGGGERELLFHKD